MNIVSAPMADNYGKIRCCEFLPVSIVKYENGKIVEEDISGVSYNYHEYGIEQLVAETKDLYERSAGYYTLEQLFAKSSILKTIEDIEVPERYTLGSDFDIDGDDECFDVEYDDDEDDEDDDMDNITWVEKHFV